MKTRNVRKRQWERYIIQLRRMPADPARISFGPGYALQLDRRLYRLDQRRRKRLLRLVIARINADPGHPVNSVARAFNVPVKVIV